MNEGDKRTLSLAPQHEKRAQQLTTALPIFGKTLVPRINAHFCGPTMDRRDGQ